ncbi:Senecionine N-oxygenase [Eumeta japonica]|uniref:Flavin-containing monooxygenase n=1 Tax=Eumeta variegata TaxID=151549 RepID=A0A4C1ZB42_EUMVA|nr:Senecionine N-oxygenase [Eumeta japonica]
MASTTDVKVCVIGAGAAGLCAARHLLAEGVDVVVLEQAAQLGGTWVYTENVGYDSFGLPIHTSMYKSLRWADQVLTYKYSHFPYDVLYRTNLPKEIMGFPDFPVPPSEKSYLPAKDMLAFLQLYADTHGVTAHIKACIDIPSTRATCKACGRRAMGCHELRSRERGRDHDPLPLRDGDVMHSHDYRVPEIFAGKRVAVIGAGPSGMDIALEICSVTEKVYLSHHLSEKPKTVFPDNLEQKPDVLELKGKTAFFQDGTSAEVDVIFLCTGYLYNFPFLDPSCGIAVEDNCVEPLYKHLVNIHHPTMCFIGVPYYVCAFSMFDLQVRYYVRAMKGLFRLPSKESMVAHREEEMRDRAARGFTRRQAHMMGPDQVGPARGARFKFTLTLHPTV